MIEVAGFAKKGDHEDNPPTVKLDAQGRPYVTVERLDSSTTLTISATLDVAGNPVLVTDPRGVDVQTQSFDLLGRPVTTEFPDGGDVTALLDVAGQPLLLWKSGDVGIEAEVDALQRKVRTWQWAAIEDVALHLRYTARDDGIDRTIDTTALATLQVGVDSDFGESVDAVDTGFVRLVSLKRDFAEDLVAAQQISDTSVEVTVASALRDPVTTQALVGVLVVPIAADGSSVPASLGLDYTATAAQTFGTGVSYHHWTSSPPDLDDAITLSHGSETSREDPVLDRLADPPASPADGDRYLVTGTATGDWELKENQIAEYDEALTSWTFTTPTTGMAVYVEDEAVVYIYGGSWAIANWNFSDVDDIVLVLLYK